MTEKTVKSMANKIIKNHKHDENVKVQYHAYWKKYSIRLSIVAVTYFIFYAILHAVCRPRDFSGWLFGLIFIDIIATFAMISCAFMQSTFYLLDGKKYNSRKGIAMKILCFFDSMVPLMYLIAYFFYDVRTDSLTAPIWKIVVYAPLAFGVMVAMGAYMSTGGAYSSDKSKMTKYDWVQMRQQQEIAGLDPDKMPVTLSPEQMKSMSKADWYMLGQELEIAGYDVFKK
ncbi:MAG: hypothetical protein IKU41_07565 [Clostridia bacterium]|nr:hypothetical protein [Clostridia bacterium]